MPNCIIIIHAFGTVKWTIAILRDLLSEVDRSGITVWSWKMLTKIKIVLAAALVLSMASDKLARGAGAVRPCSLAGVNQALHGAIFGKKHHDAAKAYGFVKLRGEGGKNVIWGIDPNVCEHTLSSL